MASSPEEIAVRFRAAIYDLAEAHGRDPKLMTQKEFGELIGVSQQTFSNYWNGESFQRFAEREKLAATLGVRAGWLYFNEEPKRAGREGSGSADAGTKSRPRMVAEAPVPYAAEATAKLARGEKAKRAAKAAKDAKRRAALAPKPRRAKGE